MHRAPFSRVVVHVQRDDHWHAKLHQLHGQIQIAVMLDASTMLIRHRGLFDDDYVRLSLLAVGGQAYVHWKIHHAYGLVAALRGTVAESTVTPG